ncbi:MAG: hypothetical protein ABII76_20660 [Pseudomonadota bacterium]
MTTLQQILVMHGLDPCIHAAPLAPAFQGPCRRPGMDGRDEPGHDGW